MEITNTDTIIALIDKFIFSDKAANRIANFIISMEQIKEKEDCTIPIFLDEDYILKSSLESKVNYVISKLIPYKEYRDIITSNFKRLSAEVSNLIENSGLMKITLDKNHYPEIESGQISSIAKLCVSFHYFLINSESLLTDFTEYIKLTEIESYINIFINHFTGIDLELFYEPNIKSTAIFKVSKMIEKSGLIFIDFNN